MSRRTTIQQINLKGWEPVFVALPVVLPVLQLNVLAALLYPLGVVMGYVSLAWQLQNRPDLFNFDRSRRTK